MTNEEKKRLSTFEARVRQLILQYKTLQEQNDQLQSVVMQKDKEIAKLQTALDTERQNYKHLKIAKYLEISDGDIKSSRMRISRLVREINQCIRLLNRESMSESEE